jgi:DedD protein
MEESRVKERLTGAIILVALLVLLVPELLTGPSHSAPAAHVANSDGAQMRSYTIDLADDAAQKPASTTGAESPSPAPQPVPAAAASEAGRPAMEAGAADSKAGEVKSDGSAETEAAGARGPESSDGASESPNARPGDDAESASPAPPRPEPSAVVPKPQPTRSASVQRPASPPPVPHVAAESSAGAGWAVQAGVFANRDNAERLARQLKGKGFAASVSESAGKGKRLWRVRVGPEADRAAAVALGARLRAAGQSGAVVSLP